MSFKLVSIKDVPKSKLKKFDCGTEVLNEFLSHYSLKNDTLGIGRTFVAFDDKDEVAGYFTLVTAQVVHEDIPDEYRGKLPSILFLHCEFHVLLQAKIYREKELVSGCLHKPL